MMPLRDIKTMKLKTISVLLLGLSIAAFLLLSACGSEEAMQDSQSQDLPPETTIQPTITTSDKTSSYPEPEGTDVKDSSAYPASDEADGEENSAYPGPANSELPDLSAEPPNPSFDLPDAGVETGVVGGILIQEMVGEGFIPFTPYELILAEVIEDTEGNPSLIGYDEDSPRAQMFPTGVFIFENISPGEYGIIANLAVYEFPLQELDGSRLLISVEAGQAIDLGQVITQLP